MNKAELIEAIHGQFETKTRAGTAVEAVVDAIKAGLKKTGKVRLVGFGSFAVKTRKARKGRNPQTDLPPKAGVLWPLAK